MKRTGFTNGQINEIMQRDGITRKSAIRKLRRVNVQALAGTTAPKAKKAGKAKVVKTRPITAGKARSAGVQLFILAGRPTKEQFILVYGERGPKMTWEQRAAAGVPAEQFQAALASAQGQK